MKLLLMVKQLKESWAQVNLQSNENQHFKDLFQSALVDADWRHVAMARIVVGEVVILRRENERCKP